MKKIITLFICLAMIVSMGSIVFAEDPEPGAFSQIDLYEEVHMAIEETEPTGIYYVPAQIENEAYFYVGATAQPDAVPDAADAPVFILYADYENQEEALESITSTGLKDLADLKSSRFSSAAAGNSALVCPVSAGKREEILECYKNGGWASVEQRFRKSIGLRYYSSQIKALLPERLRRKLKGR